ncbi:MAG TPA: hypothetical protein VFU49_07915 [Ktedonobacteraceae bacterium]|nr:hypothetical protein [Ktedonobacteraceae bacterium]
MHTIASIKIDHWIVGAGKICPCPGPGQPFYPGNQRCYRVVAPRFIVGTFRPPAMKAFTAAP